ncbi:hypothetical protein DWG18_09595 [Lysobacter sp. TY2-98]|uniref:hypothetical protein n=1 Tax=Lysobacter sp. TY2-98 TaxID=2290922 RepID=UPI000E208F32|nr:hypothetical protein [Lysobacter sp. TY2-98]AXK72498.1 hypothetical protein DWG18_09595 [Lysobacter sp. TY2-98]
MGFVLIVLVIVIAGWVFLARNGSTGTGTSSSMSDDYVPVNAYDNPYDTNENNDRPFEPDSCEDTSDDSSSSDTCDSGDSASSD